MANPSEEFLTWARSLFGDGILRASRHLPQVVSIIFLCPPSLFFFLTWTKFFSSESHLAPCACEPNLRVDKEGSWEMEVKPGYKWRMCLK